MPEADAGGPLGVVRDGDVITLDLAAMRLDVDLTPEEISRRLRESPFQLVPAPRGWLEIYRGNVQPIETTGATLLPPAG